MKKLTSLLVSFAAAGGLSASAQTLAVQLKAADYNSNLGVWLDSSGSGNNAVYSGSGAPTVVPGATPNGSTALDLTGIGSFVLSSSIAPINGYTVFAFIEPSTDAALRNALTGGSSPTALEYDVYGGNADYLTEYTADVAHGNATLPTTSFSLIDLAVSSSGSTFALNGSPDGTGPGATFGSAITRIGNNEGGGDGFVGDVAEIDIYTGILTPTQIAAQESVLTAEYVTAVPEPTTYALMAGGATLLLACRRLRRA